MMNKKSPLFWQPHTDYLRLLASSKIGRPLLVFLNYVIWLFFFYLSYLLIRSNFIIFWQLLLATFFAELIERSVKKKIFWRRPMFLRHDVTPPGLVDNWYRTGSFPSGHTIKVAFFCLFLIQYPVFSLPIFLLICSFLLMFRILVGFHYPIDILGGLIIGFLIWIPIHLINFSSSLNYYLQIAFNTFFFIK